MPVGSGFRNVILNLRGSGVVGATGGGVAVKVGAGTVYTKTGYGTAAGAGGGVSASVTPETGFGVAGGTGSGTSASVFQKTGAGVAGTTGSGTRASVFVKTGAGVAGTAGAGSSASVYQETGYGTVGGVGSGVAVKAARPILRSDIGMQGSSSSGTSITVEKPTDAVSGDTIWAVITVGTTANPITAPDGSWTQLEVAEIFSPQPGTIQLWEKVAGGSEPSTYTFTQTDTTNWATLAVAAGGGTVTRYGADSGTDTTGPTHATGTVTTSAANDLALSFFGQDNVTSDGTFAPSLPVGLTELGEVWGSGNIGLAGYVETRAAAGTSNHEVTQTGGGDPTRGTVWVIFAVNATVGAFTHTKTGYGAGSGVGAGASESITQEAGAGVAGASGYGFSFP